MNDPNWVFNWGISHLRIKISEMREDILDSGTSSFKQTKQNYNRLRIEGEEAFLVNGPNSALIRA